MLCISCRNSTNKYRCPVCEEPYCSVACYNKHKEQECKVQLKPKEAASVDKCMTDDEPTLHDPFGTEDTVRREQLERLKNADDLHQLLHNPHLRQLMHEIDVAPNVWKAMSAAMQEPLFVEFADACLRIVEPPSEKD